MSINILLLRMALDLKISALHRSFVTFENPLKLKETSDAQMEQSKQRGHHPGNGRLETSGHPPAWQWKLPNSKENKKITFCIDLIYCPFSCVHQEADGIPLLYKEKLSLLYNAYHNSFLNTHYILVVIQLWRKNWYEVPWVTRLYPWDTNEAHLLLAVSHFWISNRNLDSKYFRKNFPQGLFCQHIPFNFTTPIIIMNKNLKLKIIFMNAFNLSLFSIS